MSILAYTYQTCNVDEKQQSCKRGKLKKTKRKMKVEPPDTHLGWYKRMFLENRLKIMRETILFRNPTQVRKPFSPEIKYAYKTKIMFQYAGCAPNSRF